MLLDSLVKQVAVLDKMVNDLRLTMRHASPHSVNELRKQKEELEAIYEELMESCVLSNFDLEHMLAKHEGCLRDCFRPTYTGLPVSLPRPKWDTPPPPPEPVPPLPTVLGVNLILYIDTTGSMRTHLGTKGALRKELEAFSNYIKTESTRANIPCTISLVWFGDASEGDGRKTYYEIAMNKESVSGFPTKIASPKWYRGGSGIPESGILCMKETLSQVVKTGVANTLIYVTDAPSKVNEYGATPDQVKQLFTSNSIKPYAIHPIGKEPDINYLFADKRDFTKPPYNIIAWADKTLRP